MGVVGSGRKKIPSNIHLLHGNPSKIPMGKFTNEPKPKIPSKFPDPPPLLTKNKIAKREWRRVGPELYELGLLTELEINLFATYCLEYSGFMEALEYLDIEGLIIETPKYESPKKDKAGNELPIPMSKKPSPWISIRDQRAKAMRQCMNELGMNPSSRSRLNVQPKEEGDDLDKLRKNRK